MNKIEIDGVEYVPVDTPIILGMDVSCKECDIFKARETLTMSESPLCMDEGYEYVHDKCCDLYNNGILRTYKKVKK
jgi:hypothetical protein